jgi:hypothetical protein
MEDTTNDQQALPAPVCSENDQLEGRFAIMQCEGSGAFIVETGLLWAEAWEQWTHYNSLCDEPHVIAAIVSDATIQASNRCSMLMIHDPLGLLGRPIDNSPNASDQATAKGKL